MSVYVTRVPSAWTGSPYSVLHPEPLALPYLRGYFKTSHTGSFALISFSSSAVFLLKHSSVSDHRKEPEVIYTPLL